MCREICPSNAETSEASEVEQDVFDRMLIYVIVSLFVIWIGVGVWYLVKTIRADNSPLVGPWLSLAMNR